MDLKDKIDIYEGFPKEGISFKDICSLLLDPKAFQQTVNTFYDIAKTMDANKIMAPEARGFIIGCPLSYKMGLAFVPIRKPGKLPGEVIAKSYALEYGEDTIEVQKEAVKPGDRIIIVDDLVATGGTLKAAVELIEELGAEVAGIICLIELTDLNARKLLKGYTLETIVKYNN